MKKGIFERSIFSVCEVYTHPVSLNYNLLHNYNLSKSISGICYNLCSKNLDSTLFFHLKQSSSLKKKKIKQFALCTPRGHESAKFVCLFLQLWARTVCFFVFFSCSTFMTDSRDWQAGLTLKSHKLFGWRQVSDQTDPAHSHFLSWLRFQQAAGKEEEEEEEEEWTWRRQSGLYMNSCMN